MPFTTAIDNKILDHFTTKTTWAARTADATWIGLSSTTPNKGGTGVTEPSGGSYARVQTTASEYNAAASSATSINADQAFATATADWVSGANLTYICLFDQSSAGNLIAYVQITTYKSVLTNDTIKVISGDLTLTLT